MEGHRGIYEFNKCVLSEGLHASHQGCVKSAAASWPAPKCAFEWPKLGADMQSFEAFRAHNKLA